MYAIRYKDFGIRDNAKYDVSFVALIRTWEASENALQYRGKLYTVFYDRLQPPHGTKNEQLIASFRITAGYHEVVLRHFTQKPPKPRKGGKPNE